MIENVFYRIQVLEQLDDHWSAWFDGLTLTHEKDNTTVLHGPVADQAALYGLLDRTRDLGLTLVSVQRIATVGSHQWHRSEQQENGQDPQSQPPHHGGHRPSEPR
jgi:hypothetical protein